MNDMNTEQWKEIAGFPKYEVSNMGRVRTIKAKRPVKSRLAFKDKYLKVSLGAGSAGRTKPKRVHRLVALHFVDGYKPGLHVNHKDGNRLNNRFDNLQWTTQAENNRHSYEVLGNVSPMLKGKREPFKTPSNKVTAIEQVLEFERLNKSGISSEVIGPMFGINGTTVRRYLRKLRAGKLFDSLKKVA